MSSKYQREIEEILAKMDSDAPTNTAGARIRTFQRPRPQRQGPSLSLASLSLWLLLLSVLLLMAASGLGFYNNTPTVVSGGLGVAAFVVLLLALVVGWRDRFRGSPVTTMVIGRRSPAARSPFPSYDDGGVVNADPNTPRPLRRTFLDGLRTRFRLMRLRNRYRQRHEEE